MEVDESYFVLHQQLAEYSINSSSSRNVQVFNLAVKGGLFYKFPSIARFAKENLIHDPSLPKLSALDLIHYIFTDQGKSIFVSARRQGKLILPSEHCLHTVRPLNQPCFISKSARETGQLQTNILLKCPT